MMVLDAALVPAVVLVVEDAMLLPLPATSRAKAISNILAV